MSTKIFISTNKNFSLIALSLLMACQSPQHDPSVHSPTSPETGASADTIGKGDKNVSDLPLDEESAVPFLRDYALRNTEQNVVVHTDFGDIHIELYENTPLHRANFLYLTERNYFDGTWFYRVSPGHVIQAGNNDEPALVEEKESIGSYTLPAEQLEQNLHKTGAVAAARSYKNNADKRSDPYEFYIVLGQKYSAAQLSAMEEEYDLSLSGRQKKVYSIFGGSPHLDGEHTVFGRVTKGMKVVRQINQVETDEGEWPLQNVPITVEQKK